MTKSDPNALPADKGAYVLRIVLDAAAPLPARFGAGAVLPAGVYEYCGSANGAGGIRARVARHLKRDKKLKWHVDWLTTRAAAVTVEAHPGGDECRLVAARLRKGATVPIPGFGSSDCATCASHLIAPV